MKTTHCIFNNGFTVINNAYANKEYAKKQVQKMMYYGASAETALSIVRACGATI